MRGSRSRKPYQLRNRGKYRSRVHDDVELYYQVCGNAIGEGSLSPAELAEMVRLQLEGFADWTLKEMATRSRLVCGCIRMELGRRLKLDPNQLRLMEGV